MEMRRQGELGGQVSETAKATTRRRHQITLKSRENLALDGVTRVESFDDCEVVLETDQGGLIVRGENLHIKELNLEAGTMHVDGLVQSVQYTGDTLGQKGKGLIGRLFR